jgi:hypothetical protein
LAFGVRRPGGPRRSFALELIIENFWAFGGIGLMAFLMMVGLSTIILAVKLPIKKGD